MPRENSSNSGRTLFTDDDLRTTLDGRIRQLEGELEGNRISMAEAEADPHDTVSADVHRRNIESISARLQVVRERRAAIAAPPPPSA